MKFPGKWRECKSWVNRAVESASISTEKPVVFLTLRCARLLSCSSVAVQGKNSSARVGAVTLACGRTRGPQLRDGVEVGVCPAVLAGKVERKARRNSRLFSPLFSSGFAFV